MNFTKSLFLFSLLFCIASLSAQNKGIHINAGIAVGQNANVQMTPEGTAHPGIFIGLSSRLRPTNKFSIFGSGKYVDLEFIAKEGDFATRTETMKWAKFRLGGLYKVVEFNKSTNIRVSAAGAIDLLLDWPDDLPAAPFNRFNTFTTGVVLGLGADIRGITIDFEYEIGILDQITDVPDSAFSYWDLGIGVVF
jgi:hypothetical protein